MAGEIMGNEECVNEECVDLSGGGNEERTWGAL